ncbi:MAG: hypothetical protein KBS60_04230 [Phascolarctobacterium sp.]|nr:hypothetical protein [Candidatus Phascolarctobacterium caballi]
MANKRIEDLTTATALGDDDYLLISQGSVAKKLKGKDVKNNNGVPTSRTINGKALTSNITLSASDVGAVPTTRKVNGKPLTADVVITADDIGIDGANFVTHNDDGDVNITGMIRGLDVADDAGAGKVYICPFYRFQELGLPSGTTTEDFIKKWLVKICTHYQMNNATFIGQASPNATGAIQAHILDTRTVNDEGLPQYCSGLYYAYNGVWIFRTYAYAFTAKQIATF